MPIHHAEMTPEQIAEVARALAHYLAFYDDGPDAPLDNAPVVPGTVRPSRSGAPWVSFSSEPDGANSMWYRVCDVPPDPGNSYDGAKIVLDPGGRVLGNAGGPLVLHRVREAWVAQVINTGWNYAREIIWPGEVA